MNRDAIRNLQLDRRLMHRRGWISKPELAKQLEALPDVGHKIAPDEEDDAGASSAADAAAPREE